MANHLVFLLWALTLAASVSANLVFNETVMGSRCGARISASLSKNQSIPLVDQNGVPTTDQSIAWGIPFTACQTYCGHGSATFDWSKFSSAFPVWLLPSLALTAQLPYDAQGMKANILALFLAVGSPALITYSLTLTVLNCRWIHRKFERLRSQGGGSHASLNLKLNAAEVILRQSQQIPIQVVQGQKGWLSSVVVLPGNEVWFERIQEDLRATWRPFTTSLYAQILLVVVALIFTIVESFAKLGDNATAHGLSIASIWIWMIPVIWGWVTVGTQTRFDSVRKAFHNGNEKVLRASETGVVQQGVQAGAPRVGTAFVDRSETRDEADHTDSWMGLRLAGDEMQPGSIYNYARIYTSCTAVDHVIRTFERLIKSITGDTGQVDGGGGVSAKSETNLVRTDTGVARYCGLDIGQNLEVFPSRAPPEAGKRIFWACVMAVFVQWGSTGAGVLISYYTPTVGLGCRSGSFLLYGALSTLAWILLVAAAAFSECWSRRTYSKIRKKRASVTYCIGIVAVILRVLGKATAVVSALWLLLACIFEFTNFFQSCWCASDALSYGVQKGWATVFLSPADLAYQARGVWGGGLFLAIATALGSLIYFPIATPANNG